MGGWLPADVCPSFKLDLFIFKKYQEIRASQELVRSSEFRDSGVIYLEHERVELKVMRNGRTWKVYGSPASPAGLELCSNKLKGFRQLQGLPVAHFSTKVERLDTVCL